MKDLLPVCLGVSQDSITSVLTALMRVVPAGVTVVTSDGHVVYVNGHQRTIEGCPWTAGRITDLRRHPAIPRALRAALRRLTVDPRLVDPLQVAPLLFPPNAEPIETWLVPVREDHRLLGALILQFERRAGRIVREDHFTTIPRVPTKGAVDVQDHTPPALDVAKLGAAYGLTEREIQVIHALCLGHATPRIARDMAITGNTVKDYVKRIQRKMGVQNRLTIVSRALQLSLQTG